MPLTLPAPVPSCAFAAFLRCEAFSRELAAPPWTTPHRLLSLIDTSNRSFPTTTVQGRTSHRVTRPLMT